MKAKALTLLMVVALMGAVVAAPMRAEAAAPTSTGITVPNIPVTTTDATGTVTNLLGSLNITGFTNQGGVLTAIGTLTSSLLNGGNPIPVAIPVLSAAGTCQILNLTVGAIHLDLLGLVVDTNTIHLQINAQSGPGNLLGNLLCAVAHLLDGTGPLGSLAGLLNNILRNL